MLYNLILSYTPILIVDWLLSSKIVYLKEIKSPHSSAASCTTAWIIAQQPTLGVWPFTLPARAKEPWTLPKSEEKKCKK